jgi:hypothetical protein
MRKGTTWIPIHTIDGRRFGKVQSSLLVIETHLSLPLQELRALVVIVVYRVSSLVMSQGSSTSLVMRRRNVLTTFPHYKFFSLKTGG